MQNKYIFASILISFVGLAAMAQESGRFPSPPTPSNGPGPPGLPIDGGIVILFVIALIFGVYKTYGLVAKKTS
ncbi:PID-CTERM protein-sorting domain-containing protein [Winogradskyella bathintestinalis]|uniref:Signal peptidase n=1 Tax=Winogradskyella bathintestinalis TaxID=3035208 RepID=A0ABT7ZR60_9FLAO|nr:hypothetical protein [Winogradskyella bathintestinalis]MDN3491502.1 hypothetical protein [Winogradskyella bathintestinalis]